MVINSFLSTLIMSFIGYAITWLYLLWPAGSVLYKPFLFNDQQITKQAYIDYASWRIFGSILFFNIWQLSIQYAPEYSGAFRIFFYAFVFLFIDYLLFYNQPITKINNIPISYALIMAVVLFLTVLIYILK